MTFGSKFKMVQEFTDDRDLLIQTVKGLTLGDSSDLQGLAATAADEGDDSGSFVADQTEFNIFNTDRKLTALEDAARKLSVYPGKESADLFFERRRKDRHRKSIAAEGHRQRCGALQRFVLSGGRARPGRGGSRRRCQRGLAARHGYSHRHQPGRPARQL